MYVYIVTRFLVLFLLPSGPQKLAVATCSSSSYDNTDFLCDNVYDGDTAPGLDKEWAAAKRDTNAWIRLDFASAKMVAMIKLWWRCSGSSQFSELKFSFSDGSTQKVKVSSHTNFPRDKYANIKLQISSPK